jgi:hypothetical protein
MQFLAHQIFHHLSKMLQTVPLFLKTQLRNDLLLEDGHVLNIDVGEPVSQQQLNTVIQMLLRVNWLPLAPIFPQFDPLEPSNTLLRNLDHPLFHPLHITHSFVHVTVANPGLRP